MNMQQIENRMNEIKQMMEDLRINYAQPYMKNFKKHYLWTDSVAEKKYNDLSLELGTLAMEKKNVEQQ